MKTNMSNEKYRANKAYSRSDLFHMSKSPAHFKYALENPEPETPALLFGTAFHTYVLEREKFDRDYRVGPKIDGRTKEGKALLAQVNESGRVMLSEEQFEQIKRMTESVMSNKYAAALINNGDEERARKTFRMMRKRSELLLSTIVISWILEAFSIMIFSFAILSVFNVFTVNSLLFSTSLTLSFSYALNSAMKILSYPEEKAKEINALVDNCN